MGTADNHGSQHVRMLLGVYVLGSLSEHEGFSVRAHLARCASCRAEYDELADLPALLGLLAEDEMAGGFGDLRGAPASGSRSAEAAARRRHRWYARIAAAAAGAVVLAAGGTAAWELGTRTAAGPGTAARVHETRLSVAGLHAHARSASTGVSISVTLKRASWGTKIELAVWHLPRDQRCTLIALGPGGARETAASWQNSSQTSADVLGAVAFSIRQLSRLDVVAATGQTLVSVRVP
jgi:predicted anti-sigma-YlaC factor YlaD